MNHVFARLCVRLHELKRDEQGQDVIEYALLATLIAMVCVAGVPPFAIYINTLFANVSSSLA